MLITRWELLDDVDEFDAVFEVALDCFLLDTIWLPNFHECVREMILKSCLILEVAIVEEGLYGPLNKRLKQIAIINTGELGYLILNFHEVGVVRHLFFTFFI